MEIAALQQKAQRLHDIRHTIANKEEELKQLLEPLKTERDAIQDDLLKDMAENQVATLKVASGESYIRSVRKSVQITNLIAAEKWAIEHHAVSVDRRKAASLLSDAEELPTGFERVETPFISIRKPKDEKST